MEDNLEQRLQRLDCCAVSDALDSLSLTGFVAGLYQLSTTKKIAGRVVTVELVSVAENDSAAGGKVQHLGTEAIESAHPGDVIVVKQAEGSTAGCWGGILSLGASVAGVAGVIAHGFVRDIDEAKNYQFPVYALGTTARTARGRVRELRTNHEIQFAGVAVQPADFVIADGSGVAFIKASDAERVITAAERIAAKEALMAKAVLALMPITKVMGKDYEHLLK
ncbi:RraA family protein [Caballeronia sp. 15711]|uniref:RraA family protein n=1 Tax=Caballeronia sp. 15711 TaxID=3391029 RepID=UPI0039E325F3